MRNCPDCNIALNQQTFGGVTLDVCPQCAGVLFDDGEITQLAKQGSDALREAEKMFLPQSEPVLQENVIRICPACSNPMQKYKYLYTSPVELDECTNCFAVWVQEGELKSMGEAMDQIEKEKVDDNTKKLLRQQYEIARMEAEHIETLEKHSLFRRVMRTLSLRRSMLT